MDGAGAARGGACGGVTWVWREGVGEGAREGEYGEKRKEERLDEEEKGRRRALPRPGQRGRARRKVSAVQGRREAEARHAEGAAARSPQRREASR